MGGPTDFKLSEGRDPDPRKKARGGRYANVPSHIPPRPGFAKPQAPPAAGGVRLAHAPFTPARCTCIFLFLRRDSSTPTGLAGKAANEQRELPSGVGKERLGVARGGGAEVGAAERGATWAVGSVPRP